MKRTTLILVVRHESDDRETIETQGETIQEVVRHIPVRKRMPTIHRALPPQMESLAKWVQW